MQYPSTTEIEIPRPILLINLIRTTDLVEIVERGRERERECLGRIQQNNGRSGANEGSDSYL